MATFTEPSAGVAAAFARRAGPAKALAAEAERVAGACRDMAERFHAGGTLVVFGTGGASTDAGHVSVEFVHPVIVGKRALPAISLTNDVATTTGIDAEAALAHQLRRLARAQDIALGVSSDGTDPGVLRALEVAKELGLLTVALVGGDGGPVGSSPMVDHAFVAGSDDPLIVKEIQVTTYHVLWELVHVFFEQPGLLGPAIAGPDPSAQRREGNAIAARGTCDDSVCVTCSDEGVPVRVVELLGGGLARVDTGRTIEEVSVALVDARVGDTVLVHAKEAIAVVSG